MVLACLVKDNIVANIIQVENEEAISQFEGYVYLGKYPNIGDEVVNGAIPNMTEREADLDSVHARSERNLLLKMSDWTQLPDSPLSDAKKAEWATYRQALRDMPSQEGFPGINFPDMPA